MVPVISYFNTSPLSTGGIEQITEVFFLFFNISCGFSSLQRDSTNEILTFRSHFTTHDFSGLFCVILERTQMNEKVLRDDSNTTYKKIDCIHFANLSLYSVNTNAGGRTVKKNKNE